MSGKHRLNDGSPLTRVNLTLATELYTLARAKGSVSAYINELIARDCGVPVPPGTPEWRGRAVEGRRRDKRGRLLPVE